MGTALRAVLVDDEATARADLRAMLAAHPEIAIVGEAATVNSARARLAPGDYDLVFLDVQLLGGTGFDVLPSVRAGAQVIFVTAHQEHAIRAFEVHALDYLLKPVAQARLAASLRRAQQLAAALSGPRAAPPASELVSEREAEIMNSLVRGLAYKEIADELGISTATVKNHLSRIYEKLSVRSRTEAAVKWLAP